MPIRIEWIDDSSANIVYDTPAAALRALKALSREEIATSMITNTLRPAKSASGHPEANLEIRTAVFEDRKQPGARDRSRYYLLNPDEDPGEKKRGKYRQRGDNEDFRRRRYDEQEQRRRRTEDAHANFDASLYDDVASDDRSNNARRKRRSTSVSTLSSREDDSSNRGRRVRIRPNARKEFFGRRMSVTGKGRLRNRSASPGRDIDNDLDRHEHSQLIRSSPGPDRRRSPSTRAADNRSKELFPSRDSGIGQSEDTPMNEGRELFPQKASTSLHRRSAAFDAADETADLFAGRMAVPFTDGMTERSRKPKKLIDRVGRLSESDQIPHSIENDEIGEFNIRGAAKQQTQGFSIRGAAASQSKITAKELFPDRFDSNSGKELFSGKLQGRGGGRRRAEDMFS